MSDEQGWVAPGPAGQVPHGPPPQGPAYGPGSAPPPPPQSPSPQWLPPSAPAPRLDHRPGVIPLRPLTMNEIWGGVFATVRGNPAATLGLALLTMVLFLVPTTALAMWIAGEDLQVVQIDDGSSDAFVSAALASYVPLFAMIGATILLQLFMALVIGHAVRGRKISLAQTWHESRGRILTGIGVVLVLGAIFLGLAVVAVLLFIGLSFSDSTALIVIVGLLTGVGFLVLGILLWVRLGFAMSIVVLEGAGVRRSLARSWQLTSRQDFWRIFGIRLLTSIVASIAGSVVAMPISLISSMVMFGDGSGESMLWLFPLSQSLGALIQGVLVTPFTAGVDALLYVDQRMRREGLDVQIMQQLQTTGG